MDIKNNKDVQAIEWNYDNISILEIVKYLINVVINDIDYMNEENIKQAEDYLIDYDLGNNNYIMSEDLESLSSIVDTINNVLKYNEKKEEGVE